MSEPQRTQPQSGPGPSSPADAAAQIERLLLSGLDLYFTGQYQEAINIWTRVVFLERGHGRARAYIERARTAIAEQQRESDELFHRGRAAYNQGDLDQARQLLTRAIERGGSSDDALVLLQQLNRFSSTATSPAAVALPAPEGLAGAIDRGQTLFRLAVAVAVVSTLALLAAPLFSWFVDAPATETRGVATAAVLEPLPIARTGNEALESARQLYAGGHLADALRALDRIDFGDPVRPQAEALKGDIQRDLLATVRQSQQSPSKGVDSR